MDNQEIKVRSIRADESTYEKFKTLSAEFDNQGDCLSQLISAYEINNAKHVLVDMQADIADYESHIGSIQNAFLHVLELNNNAEQRIRHEFADQLSSKDKIISDLQERAECAEKALEHTKEECQDNIQNAAEELSALKNKLLETQKDLAEERKKDEQNERSLSDKQTIIENLMLRLPEQDKINKYIAELESADALKGKEIDKLQSDIRSKELEINELNIQINNLNERQKYQKTLSEQQLQIEKQQIELQIKGEYQAKIDNYNTKMEKMQDKIAALQEKIDKLKNV